MNNRGFTLVELLVTLVILSLLAGFGTYSIIEIINSSKEKDYNNLIMNIKDACEEYYLECKYEETSSIKSICDKFPQITLGELVNYGYLTGNKKNDDGSYSIEDPKSKKNISSCEISISYSNGKISINRITEGICPAYGD